MSLTTGAGLGRMFAAIAIVCGLVGLVLASRARTRGGLIRFFSVFAGLVGFGAALI